MRRPVSARPHGKPQPESLPHHEPPNSANACDDDQHDGAAVSVTQRALGGDLVPVVGQQGPGHEIDGDADAPEDGQQHEGGADDHRVDAEPVGEP
jgi:hypothetical protein